MAITKISVRGARQHNLKNISVEIPRNSLTVVTGLSGSGKSSLAFDTIYAEGQRRYVETLSAYARQYLDQMERPDVDSIEGLSPSISIEQKTTSRSPRSTVGTITEIYDYLRLLYASIGIPHCPQCGQPISRQSAEQIMHNVMQLTPEDRVMLLAPIVDGSGKECNGLSSIYDFDPALIIVDWSKPLLDGALGPGSGSTYLQRMLQIAATAYKVDLNTPFEQFPLRTQNLLLYGPGEKEAPRTGFRGVISFLRQNLEEATSDSYREWLLNYMSGTECPECGGKRLRPESLAVKVNGTSIADFTAQSVTRALEAAAKIKLNSREQQIAG